MMAGRRLWITIAAVVGGIVLILLIAIPFLLNADNYRPRVQSMLSDATGRQVTLGHLSFSLFSGSLTADQLSISEDPAFGQQPFVQAKQLHIGIEVGAAPLPQADPDPQHHHRHAKDLFDSEPGQ